MCEHIGLQRKLILQNQDTKLVIILCQCQFLKFKSIAWIYRKTIYLRGSAMIFQKISPDPWFRTIVLDLRRNKHGSHSISHKWMQLNNSCLLSPFDPKNSHVIWANDQWWKLLGTKELFFEMKIIVEYFNHRPLHKLNYSTVSSQLTSSGMLGNLFFFLRLLYHEGWLHPTWLNYTYNYFFSFSFIFFFCFRLQGRLIEGRG